jgi:hypothetical protein
MHRAPRKWFFYPIAAIGVLVAAEAYAEMFKGYPDEIICRVGDSQIITYLAAVKDDGSALYKPLLAEFYATVTPDHIFHHQGTKDCDGKSIDQLVKDGQTRTLGSGH